MKISHYDYSDQNYHGYISIITVLVKCAGDQKVPTRKSLQVLYFFLNQQTTNKINLFA